MRRLLIVIENIKRKIATADDGGKRGLQKRDNPQKAQKVTPKNYKKRMTRFPPLPFLIFTATLKTIAKIKIAFTKPILANRQFARGCAWF